MKILQVTKYFYPNKGGIESNVLGISEELVSRGEEVIVLSSNYPKTKKLERYKGIKIKRSSIFFTLFRDPFAPGILIDLFRENYELIHLHLPDPFNSVFAYSASLIRRKPLIVTYHADIIKEKWYYKPFTFLYSFWQDLVLKRSSYILVTTLNYAKESKILRKLEFQGKVKVVHNFVDEKKFHPKNEKKAKKKYPHFQNKKVILFLGRLIPYKGVNYLLKAFPEVKKEVKNAQLVIAGKGPLKKELVRESKDMKGIIFMEPRDAELPLLYSLSDVFVLPSITRQEAFGITLLEAMASGKPCISTNISGMPSVIGETGILVPAKNSKELSQALIKILSNQELAKKLGQKARKRVEEKFTREKAVDKLMEVYEKVLDHN